MRDRVARLRRWLAAGGLLLLAVIAAFIGYGRYVSHLRHLKLPLPPGVNIVREGGGWTYSRAVGSKTLYTIHAANFQQGKNGKTSLHDVSVVLYGKKDDRRDRLSGESFEYDEKGGVLRALGVVHIDLEGAAEAQLRREDAGGQTSAPSVIHVTTSDLVYLEKLGIAATGQDIDVQSGAMSGHARGADYNSDTGILMLHSAVKMTGTSGGRPVRITAGEAQFDQRAQRARLVNATYESEGRSISAHTAVLHRRSDGTLEKIDADGGVELVDGTGKASARRTELQMNAAGNPASALLTGDVRYSSEEALRQIRSQAEEARVSFTGNRSADPEHTVFSGAVHMAERTRASAASSQWSSRDLEAQSVEAWFDQAAGGKALLRNAEARGNAKLVVVDTDASARRPATRTEVAADELKAAMSAGTNGVRLDTVTGRGHTSLLQVNPEGVEQTSQGDTLQASFRPSRSGAAGSATTEVAGAQTLVSAVQQGHVTMTRRQPAKSGGNGSAGEQMQRASAERATYDGVKDQLLLSGAVRVSDPAGAVWAEQVTMDRDGGEAHAQGAVKLDYVANAGQEPMHILAARADLHNGTASATFFGNPVRVWQGGSQIQAPEVEIDRGSSKMTARSGGSANGSVRTVLVSAGGQTTAGSPAAAPAPCGASGATGASAARTSAGSASSAGAVRITSSEVVYSGASQQVEFTGGIRADTAEISVRAARAVAHLATQRISSSAPFASLESGLERLVVSGHVELARGMSRATGDQLVYETAGRSFVLSGASQEPARAVDARGTSTAAAFRFTACDDRLEALGEAPGIMGQRVETEANAGAARKRDRTAR